MTFTPKCVSHRPPTDRRDTQKNRNTTKDSGGRRLAETPVALSDRTRSCQVLYRPEATDPSSNWCAPKGTCAARPGRMAFERLPRRKWLDGRDSDSSPNSGNPHKYPEKSLKNLILAAHFRKLPVVTAFLEMVYLPEIFEFSTLFIFTAFLPKYCHKRLACAQQAPCNQSIFVNSSYYPTVLFKLYLKL